MIDSRMSRIQSFALQTMERVNLPWCVTQHGPKHVQRVVSYLEQLLRIFTLKPREKFLLRAAAWLHDIGQANFAVSEWDARERHHEYGREMVAAATRAGTLPLSAHDSTIVSDLVFRHNLETALPENETRFLTVLLRTADVMDITAERAITNDSGVHWYEVRERLERELPERIDQWDHWAGHLAINNIAARATNGGISFAFSVNNPLRADFQIQRFAKKNLWNSRIRTLRNRGSSTRECLCSR